MAVTDLTGYTWTCNSIQCSAGYGKFNINYTYNGEEWSNHPESQQLCIGYTRKTPGFPEPVTAANSVFMFDMQPTIGFVSIGDYLTFTDGTDVTNTDLIAWLQATGILTPPQTNITLDLSTLSLRTGTHSIQIRLSDDGVTKRDSELSNAVTYVVAPQLSAPQNPVAITSDGTDFAFEPVENAESYEIFADGVSIGECTPEPEPTGETWVINEEPTLPDFRHTIDQNITFISNNNSFNSIQITTSTIGYDNSAVLKVFPDIEFGFIYNWTDQDYRTVYFPIPPTGDLRTWLNSNANLQQRRNYK